MYDSGNIPVLYRLYFKSVSKPAIGANTAMILTPAITKFGGLFRKYELIVNT